MNSHVAWTDIRAEHVARAGGEEAVEAGKREMLAEVIGHRLAEVRRARGLTQQQVADRMGVHRLHRRGSGSRRRAPAETRHRRGVRVPEQLPMSRPASNARSRSR